MSTAVNFAHVRVERRGRVAWVVLDRAERLNAFEGRMRAEIVQALQDALGDRAAWVVVVTGAGRGFCAGADIAYLQELHTRQDVAAFAELVDTGREVATLLRRAAKPVLAAVNGPAAGGGANLALACDLRIASEEASIGQTFIRIGLHPDFGGTFFLPRMVGTSRALELLWTGRMVKAAEALELGLFDYVVPAAKLEEEVTRLAETLAAAAPEVLGRVKAAIYGTSADALAQALAVEHESQLALFTGEDVAEGLRAFLEKRPPVFKG